MARSQETLDDLSGYLEQSGIAAQALDAAEPERVASRSCAVVLFPDDFDASAALGFVRALRRARPRVLVVVVTRERQRLESALDPDDRSVAPIVLPRPSFGWSIVDAIRAHRQAEAAT